MTVTSPARPAVVHVPAQAPPLDPPPPARPAPAPLLGRDRPLTADERQCLVGLVALALVLGSVIVTFLLLSAYVWG